MALGDALNNLAGGYQRGQAQYAANEDARQKAAAAGAKAAQDAAEFRLKLATHSQALTNSAESEWNAIMGEVNSPNWDPAKLPMLLPRVANFQKTYGAVWGGGDAMKTVRDALHLDGGGQMEEGKQGPVDPNATSPMWGFATEEQVVNANKVRLAQTTAAAAHSLQLEAVDYLDKNVPRDVSGMYDVVQAPLALLKWRAAKMASGDYDEELFMKVMDDLTEQLGTVIVAGNSHITQGREYKEALRVESSKGSQWVNQQFATSMNGMGDVTSFMEGSEGIRNAMDSEYQRLLLLDLDPATIKIMIAQNPKYSDPETGRWRIAGKESPLHQDPLSRGYSQAGPDFAYRVQAMAAAGQMNPATDIPVFNPITGESGVVNVYTQEWVGGAPFTPAKEVPAEGAAGVEKEAETPIKPAKEPKPRDKYGVVIQDLSPIPGIDAIPDRISKTGDLHREKEAMFKQFKEGKITGEQLSAGLGEIEAKYRGKALFGFGSKDGPKK